ncbi:MAG TPA: hypothetical protein VFW83_06095 [Bryobacteraceae bacterium]|nr:hypothetical protein [Bryobacteraceae bacterium]
MATATVLPVNQPQPDIKQRALTLSESARALSVVDQGTYNRACDMLLGIKDLLKQADTVHDPSIAAAHAAHKAALKAKGDVAAPLQDAERILKCAIGSWEAEQRRIQEEAERKARVEAERLQAEALESQIEEAEAAGASENEVLAIIEQPRPVMQPVVVPVYERTKGVSTLTVYSAEVFDMKALCRAVAEGRASANLVTPNNTALNQMARAMKETFNIPGVRLITSTNVRAGGR